MNFDLAEYRHALRHRAMAVYHQIIQATHSKLKPLIGGEGVKPYELLRG